MAIVYAKSFPENILSFFWYKSEKLLHSLKICSITFLIPQDNTCNFSVYKLYVFTTQANNPLEMVLQLHLGAVHLVNSLLQGGVRGVALVTQVVADVVQHVVDQRPQVDARHPLAFRMNDVLVRELRPRLGSARTGRFVRMLNTGGSLKQICAWSTHLFGMKK